MALELQLAKRFLSYESKQSKHCFDQFDFDFGQLHIIFQKKN